MKKKKEYIQSTTKTVRAVKHLYILENYTAREIAKELGLPHKHILHLIKYNNIKKKVTPVKRVELDDLRTVKEMYLDQGKTAKKVAKVSGMSYYKVRYILERYKLKRSVN